MLIPSISTSASTRSTSPTFDPPGRRLTATVPRGWRAPAARQVNVSSSLALVSSISIRGMTRQSYNFGERPAAGQVDRGFRDVKAPRATQDRVYNSVVPEASADEPPDGRAQAEAEGATTPVEPDLAPPAQPPARPPGGDRPSWWRLVVVHRLGWRIRCHRRPRPATAGQSHRNPPCPSRRPTLRGLLPLLRIGGTAGPPRPFVGLRVLTKTAAIRSSLHLFPASGVVVTSVFPGSPAQAAGVMAGDVIVAVNGRRVTTTGQVTGLVDADHPGDRVRLTIDRGRFEMTLGVMLGVAPAPIG